MMISESDSLDILSDQMTLFERSADDAGKAVVHFSERMKTLFESTKTASQGSDSFAHSLEGSLKKAFGDVVTGEAKASDALRKLGSEIIDKFQKTLLGSAKKGGGSDGLSSGQFSPPTQSPSADGIPSGGDLFRSLTKRVLGFSQGGVFSQSRVIPFAGGGVVSQPTLFPMAGATGLMGEAGPEAIMPLARSADGKLGVRNAGGGSVVNVTMNVQTRDAESFRRSKSQIAADINRALSRGKRNH